MEFSFFSFLMAVIWSSLFFCILALLQKNIRFIRHFGIKMIFLIYIGCIFRFLFPVEFAFTKVVPDSKVYAAFYDFLCRDKITIDFLRVSLLDILVAVSVMITVVLTVRFSGRYLLFQRMSSFSEKTDNPRKNQILRVLKQLHGKPQYDCRIRIFYSSQVSVPVGIGLWKRKILLPCLEYTDTELYYILLHEFTHFANKDLFVKMAVALLRNIFWWNPCVYLLQRNLDEILEIKCDLRVIANMENREKADYLSVIISSLERASDTVTPMKHLPNACLIDAHKKELLRKRFLLTASSGKSRSPVKYGITCILYIFLAVVTLIGSYSFILQPQYHTPEEEIAAKHFTYVMTPDNTYLLVDETGQYYIASLHITTDEISYEAAQKMIQDGFQVKEF